MRKVDLISALALLGLSATIVLATWDLPYWSTFTPGPAFASFWVAACGALIGSALLAQALLRSSDTAIDWPDRTGARQVLLGAAVLWGLLILLPIIGTALAGLVFMLAFLIGVARRPLVPSLFTAILTATVIQLVFVLWLNIDLPEGPFGL